MSNVAVSTVLKTGISKINRAVAAFDQSTDSKEKEKARSVIQSSLKDYCNDTVKLIASKDLWEDPYGVIYAKNFKHEFMIDDAVNEMYELCREDIRFKFALDEIMLRAVYKGNFTTWFPYYKGVGNYASVSANCRNVSLFIEGKEHKLEWKGNTNEGLADFIHSEWMRYNPEHSFSKSEGKTH
ncbi:MAG: hypothetical protein DRQ78_08490 [Epsilonproteobacteria bacterium]|nr:MAG: hypothetical protein DRQ78_08490 [Campylobacterota bacterium]